MSMMVCTPTKTMIASAKAAWMAGNSAKLGIDIDSFSVNMPAIKKRKDDIVIKSRTGNRKGIESTEKPRPYFWRGQIYW